MRAHVLNGSIRPDVEGVVRGGAVELPGCRSDRFSTLRGLAEDARESRELFFLPLYLRTELQHRATGSIDCAPVTGQGAHVGLKTLRRTPEGLRTLFVCLRLRAEGRALTFQEIRPLHCYDCPPSSALKRLNPRSSGLIGSTIGVGFPILGSGMGGTSGSSMAGFGRGWGPVGPVMIGSKGSIGPTGL